MTPHRSEWEVEINALVVLDGFQGFVWICLTDDFVSSNQWKQFKSIET